MKDRKTKFKELAEKRVVKAIKAIRLVGNLANRSNYQYSIEEANLIIETIEGETKELRRRFSEKLSSKKIEFKI